MELTVPQILATLGAVTLLSAAYKLIAFLFLYVRPSSLPRYLKTHDGSAPWAFVTGASGGIGVAFAADLASQGFNVVLHARHEAKLDAAAERLRASFPGRQFRVVAADASEPSKINFPDIAKSLSDITLKVLVNNVGATMPRGHEFDTVENYTAAELEKNVGLNAVFPLLLTGALIPKLMAHQPSLIINMGSFSDMCMPLFPAYSPAKAFVKASSEELVLEQQYHHRNIEVIYFRALHVTDTETIKLPKSLFVPDATTWVRSALARVGCGRTNILPYLPHALQAAIFDFMPEYLSRRSKISLIRQMLKGDPMGTKAAAANASAVKTD